MKQTFKNPQLAFEEAIASGYLSERPTDQNYAGLYMYMHTDSKGDHFKHTHSREYLLAKKETKQ